MNKPSQQHILIIEDEPKLAGLIADYLAQAGYATSQVDNGLEAVAKMRETAPDLILLDLMLPGKDGIQICQEIRAFSQIPIIMVTARVEEIDRLLGLQVGADDYICKPFSPREVVARVKAVLRRSAHYPADSPGERLVIEEERFSASYAGQRLDLTPVEFRLLKTLHAHPGRVFSRSQLMNELYDDYRIVTDRTVDTHIKNLRRKLDAISGSHELIHSVYGVGYKFDETSHRQSP